jgi:hypothetical protein
MEYRSMSMFSPLVGAPTDLNTYANDESVINVENGIPKVNETESPLK